MDTVMVKAKVPTGTSLPDGVTYVSVDKKSVKPGVVIEKTG
jgi:hypothetical protein